MHKSEYGLGYGGTFIVFIILHQTVFVCESDCRHSAVIMGSKCHLTTEKRQAVITQRNERLSYREKLSKKKQYRRALWVIP